MIIWFFLNVAFGSMMLEASQGIIGRNSEHVLAADDAYECVVKQQWSDCAKLWAKRADLEDNYRPISEN